MGRDGGRTGGGISRPRKYCIAVYSFCRSPFTRKLNFRLLLLCHNAATQEEVLVEPVIRHLEVNDAEMQSRIQQEISALYDFFRGLYDQDQKEISGLQVVGCGRVGVIAIS